MRGRRVAVLAAVLVAVLWADHVMLWSVMGAFNHGVYLPRHDPGLVVAGLVAAHAAAIGGLALTVAAPRWARALVLHQRVRGGWRPLARRGLACAAIGVVTCGLAWPVAWVGAAVVAEPGSPGALPAVLQWLGALAATVVVALVASRRRRDVVPWALSLFWSGLVGAMAGNALVGALSLAVGGALLGGAARSLAPTRRRDAARLPVLVGLLALLAWPGHPLTRWWSPEGTWRDDYWSWGPGVHSYDLVEGDRVRFVTLCDGRLMNEDFAAHEWLSPVMPHAQIAPRAASTGLLWPFAARRRLYRDPSFIEPVWTIVRRVRLPGNWRWRVESGMRARLAALREQTLAVTAEGVVGHSGWDDEEPRLVRWAEVERVVVWHPMYARPGEAEVLLRGGVPDVRCLSSAAGFAALADAVPARLGVPEAEWREALREPPDAAEPRTWEVAR